MKNKFTGIILFLFSSLYSYAQIDADIQNEYKELLRPPINCREASELSVKALKDSAGNETINFFLKKEKDLLDLKSEIEKHIDNFKSNFDSFRKPENNLPPGENPGFPEAEYIVIENVKKCVKASDEINDFVKSFKKDIVSRQDTLNRKLKQTILSDSAERQSAADLFLQKINRLYGDYYLKIIIRVTKIENVIKNFELKEKVYYPFAGFKLLECQLTEVKTALFLLKVTNECARIGSEFYIKAN